MKALGYGIVYGLFYMVSLLPYRALYCVSDFLYLIVYHIVRYRRALVRGNITSSFPEKSVGECVSIEKGFYRWFCDYFVETVKLLSVSSDELLRHIEFRNADEIEKCFDDGQACAALLGHYCNWELL
ncbi:MAG: acetyltransferase, partial [Prevotella sp.]|nr:acetyltransferase [Prevotella sp.]